MSRSVLLLAAASAAFAASVAVSAYAGERQWYVAIEGGVALGGDEVGGGILASPLCGILGFPCEPDWSVDSGWAGLGAIGTYVMPNLRLEGEVGYRSQTLGGLNDMTQTTVMANAIFDIPMSEEFTLSLGGGLGYNWIDMGVGDRGPLPGSDAALAYQLIAGLSYDLSDTIELTLNYRYNDAQFDDLYAEVGGTPVGSNWGIMVTDAQPTSTVSIGLRIGL